MNKCLSEVNETLKTAWIVKRIDEIREENHTIPMHDARMQAHREWIRLQDEANQKASFL